jgi:hypothetical protein
MIVFEIESESDGADAVNTRNVLTDFNLVKEIEMAVRDVIKSSPMFDSVEIVRASEVSPAETALLAKMRRNIEEIAAIRRELAEWHTRFDQFDQKLAAINARLDAELGPQDQGHADNCTCWDCAAGNYEPEMVGGYPSRA